MNLWLSLSLHYSPILLKVLVAYNTMPYNQKNIIKSKRAYQILREFRENKNYSSQIARDLNLDQSLVSDIISKLYKLNFLEKGERHKAQYYLINYEGIIDYFFEIIGEEPEGENNKKSWELLEGYIKDYLRVMEDKTIKQMLFIDFTTGLIKTMEKLDDSDKPVLDYLKDLWDLVNRKAVPQETPQGIVEDNLF